MTFSSVFDETRSSDSAISSWKLLKSHGNFRIRGHTRSQPQSQPITRLEREHTCKIGWLLKYKQHGYFMRTVISWPMASCCL